MTAFGRELRPGKESLSCVRANGDLRSLITPVLY